MSQAVRGHAYVEEQTFKAIRAARQVLHFLSAIAAVLSPGPLRTDMTRHDPQWWSKLQEPPEVIAKLRALIAGITEEVGFRGYMQVPMESKYKPWIANTIISIIFLLFHQDRL